MPSIEERLEAITHTLELVAQMQQQNQRQSEQRLAKMEAIAKVRAEDQARTEKTLARTERVMASVALLVRDHRLRDLEGA